MDHAETNIQVVVRCRCRSEREITENSPIIVSSNGAKSKELCIEAALPQSSLGVVTLPPVRTYPFDIAFGPEADQALIYHEVVAPLLDEVVKGYNCTLFAYGQTGTGKTCVLLLILSDIEINLSSVLGLVREADGTSPHSPPELAEAMALFSELPQIPQVSYPLSQPEGAPVSHSRHRRNSSSTDDEIVVLNKGNVDPTTFRRRAERCRHRQYHGPVPASAYSITGRIPLDASEANLVLPLDHGTLTRCFDAQHQRAPRSSFNPVFAL
ncbi:P-loop containing nucleoside triphosphate hydrolase protein [Mycena olivaceomarginata]|nr:P-loop containing nucleoside triphosphate hydrolase protein [Mycena olivaceomarginata]